MTSAPSLMRFLATLFSMAGSYHDLVQTTRTSALGFTARTPRVNALMPRMTSGGEGRHVADDVALGHGTGHKAGKVTGLIDPAEIVAHVGGRSYSRSSA